MNSNSKHPDIELFDRLRAGLLDDEPALAGELQRHLADCAHCRGRTDWNRISEILNASCPVPEARLAQSRRAALSGRTTAPHRRIAAGPLALAASFAAVFILGVLLMPGHVPSPGKPDTQALADAPDLYENLDFYLWLTDHQGNVGGSGRISDQSS